ncbi:hypothetical protein CB1_002263013 [Camelus ferus]|nr:hypothetical protein CB1_002263013 [Camelus ferus]
MGLLSPHVRSSCVRTPSLTVFVFSLSAALCKPTRPFGDGQIHTPCIWVPEWKALLPCKEPAFVTLGTTLRFRVPLRSFLASMAHAVLTRSLLQVAHEEFQLILRPRHPALAVPPTPPALQNVRSDRGDSFKEPLQLFLFENRSFPCAEGFVRSGVDITN